MLGAGPARIGASMHTSYSSSCIEFDQFRIRPHKREVLANGEPVALGSRAFDLLLALINARGAVLSKDELMRRAWPGRVVEENSLQAQISALRKAFAAKPELIRTVPGRGYHITADVRDVMELEKPASPLTNIAAPATELICRDSELRGIEQLRKRCRLLTLTGTGGIGKTRLALEAARRALPAFAEGAWIVDLAPISDSDLVVEAVTRALGIKLSVGEVPLVRLSNSLRSARILIVLDNCEHVIDAAARLAEALLHAGSGISLLATSREPLRAAGEITWEVRPLDVPDAVQLFLARAQDVPSSAIATIAEICRRLDGLPLAIEMAAARAGTLGIDQIAARLDDRFRLLTGGLRTALPRHQTLRATLDWSYELLPESQRRTLRCLSVFSGHFTLAMASAIIPLSSDQPGDMLEQLSPLVACSLLTVERDSTEPQYRLLESTRAYALDKLIACNERRGVALRHALYFRDELDRARPEWDTVPTDQWLATYAPHMNNLRAALDWSFGSEGDASIGAALTAASAPLWFGLSLANEYGVWLNRALTHIGEQSSPLVLQLLTARGSALIYTQGPGAEVRAALTKVIEIAERHGDTDYRLRALWGMSVASINSGEHQAALAYAERFATVAGQSHDPVESAIGRRLVGSCLHVLGRQTEAREHIESMLSHYVAPLRRSPTIRYQFEQSVAARAFLARILWLQGFSQQATRTAAAALEDARASGHAHSICHALAQAACPIALYTEDFGRAEQNIEWLLTYASKHGLDVWRTWGQALEAVLRIQRGELQAGLRQLRTALDKPRENRFSMYHAGFLGELASGLAAAGQVGAGLSQIDEALVKADEEDERWCFPELLRIKGELLCRQGAQGSASAARELFLSAIEMARAQGAVAWQRRAEASLREWLSEERPSHPASPRTRALISRSLEDSLP